ncbi:hypothetical protein B0H19DRAFT_1059869 [Mycena capillaripes]|nr:hypothetical protein B0H19DRAFT_1059869 [Mycena capillaripes]
MDSGEHTFTTRYKTGAPIPWNSLEARQSAARRSAVGYDPIDLFARIGMIIVAMSTGALAGTPVSGVFIRNETLPNFRHLILFSGIMALVGSGFFAAARLIQSRKLWAAV